jgi:hypothetical protein
LRFREMASSVHDAHSRFNQVSRSTRFLWRIQNLRAGSEAAGVCPQLFPDVRRRSACVTFGCPIRSRHSVSVAQTGISVQ